MEDNDSNSKAKATGDDIGGNKNEDEEMLK